MGSCINPSRLDTQVSIRYDKPPCQRSDAGESHEHRIGMLSWNLIDTKTPDSDSA